MSRFYLSLTLAALLGLSTIPARPVAAQDPAERVAIEQLRDSLDGARDSITLLVSEKKTIEQAKTDRDNTLLHLRLGFIAFRLGEIAGHSHFDDAGSEFEWATTLRPQWPYPWLGLGEAEDRLGDSQISVVAGLQAMFGKDHLTRAANAFAKSVQVDPSFVNGLVELASTALRQRVNIKVDLARQALRLAASTSASANPEVLLWRGRVEREVGDADSALAAFNSYVAGGGNRPLGLLEVARTRFFMGSVEGQAPYYEGAALPDTNAVASYRADLALIANDSALAEFDQNPGARRVAMLHRFWGERDRKEMLHDGERLREHYRRLYYARRNFLLVSTRRHYDIAERYRSGSADYDDRGVIYIRHGEPTERASFTAPDLWLNESWRYARADGDLVFHFVAREDVQDFKLVESVFDVLDFAATVRLRQAGPGGDLTSVSSQLAQSREHMSPIYSKLLGGGAASSQRYLTEERRMGARSIRIGTTTDSDELRFAKELSSRVELIAAGRDSASGLLQVTYAIPGSAIEPVPSNRGSLYPIRLRLSVANSRGETVARVDTTRVFLAKTPVPSTEHLVGRIAVPVTPGLLTYRLAIQEGDEVGRVFPTDTITAPEVSGRGFDVSDLVIGSRSANLGWREDAADTVFFNPVGVYQSGTEMELYYEVYGLPQGEPFKTQLAVTKEGGGGLFGLFGKKAAISLRFEDHTEGTQTRIHRSLPLEKLSTGRYHIDLLVTDSAGHEVKRRREFEVVKAVGEEGKK
ncbi:MAG: GWxTD domain-containing protein [Gemmatimonadota bacterium]